MFVNFAKTHVKESLGLFPEIYNHSSDDLSKLWIREEIKYKKIPEELANTKPFTGVCVISICVGPMSSDKNLHYDHLSSLVCHEAYLLEIQQTNFLPLQISIVDNLYNLYNWPFFVPDSFSSIDMNNRT